MSTTPSESAPGRARGVDRRLLAPTLAWAIALVVLAFAGFFSTYFGRFPRFAGTPAAIHFHAGTLVLWLGLVLLQTVLVRTGRTDLHRRVGRLAYVLIPLMFVGFGLAIDESQRRHTQVPLVAAFFDGGLFLAYVCLGLLHRRRPEHHRRYMFLALVPFINPALGRLVLAMGIMPPMVTMPVQLVVIVTLLVRARLRKTLARPYAIGLVVYLAALAGLMVMIGLWPTLPERLWQMMSGAIVTPSE
jgi:hypothetical protein